MGLPAIRSGAKLLEQSAFRMLYRARVQAASRYATIKPTEDFKPRPGAALPFLEAENKHAEQQRANASPLTLLEIQARQSKKESPIFDLQGPSGMDPSRYAEALKSLRGAGFIAIEGEALDQAVRLTDAGAEVVRLAKPA